MEPRASVERLLENATWLRALARQMLSDRGLAEDAAQETWLAALRSPPAVADERSWLARVLHNAVRQRGRAESARVRRERSSARPEGLPPTDEVVARAELHARLVKAVLALEEPYRSTLLLRYFEELPAEEIARRTGIEVATVRSRTARAREKLRASLRANGGEEPERWLAALVASSGAGPGLAAPAGTGGLLVGLKLGAVVATIALVALAVLWRGTSVGHERGAAPTVANEATGAAPPSTEAELAPGRPPSRTRREESATPPAALEATTPLSGTVLSEDGRTPIAGARVALRRGRETASPSTPAAERTGPAVLTDEHGRFALARPEHPEDGLWIEADGHFPFKLSPEDLPRSDGNEVEVVLAPLGRLELEFVDDLQQPVAFQYLEYRIEVNRGSNDFLWSYRRGFHGGQSDAAGRCVLEGLPCGMPIHLENAAGDVGYESFGTVHIDPALRVLALRVVVPRRARIVGRLVDGAGEPVGSLGVTWESYSLGRTTLRGKAAADGSFELTPVMAGHGEVRIDLDGAEPRVLAPRAGEVVDLGELVVPALTQLAGSVTSRHLTPECSGPALGSLELRAFRAGRVVAELDLRDGSFAQALTRGPLELLVRRGDFWQRGEVLVRLPLAVPATGLELSLDEACGAVEFELGAHRPPADENALVRLFAAEGTEFGRLVTAAEVKPDGAGRVRVALVTPGTYRATLWLGAGQDASTAPFEVRAGELTLVPEPSFTALRLAGRVVDAAGAPVARAMVRLRDGRYDQTLPSDADGRFAFEAVPRGRYKLGVRHGERGALELDDVDVLRPDAPGVTLVLRGFAGLTGRVLAGGEPVAGLEISAQPDGSNDAYNAITDADGAFAFERLPSCRLRFWASGHFVEIHDLVAGETHALTIELGLARTLRFLREGVPLADVTRPHALALEGDSLTRRHWRKGVAREDGFAFELPPGPALFEIERAGSDESWLALASPSGSEVELAPHTLRLETSQPWHGPPPRATLVALDGREVLSQWASPIPLTVERDAEGRLSVPCLPAGARVRLAGLDAHGRAFETTVEVAGSSSLAWP
jgi:RNA polymerase sigma factor (sigma-70 family)